jgi:hypothetical protein
MNERSSSEVGSKRVGLSAKCDFARRCTKMVKPARLHTRFVLRQEFKDELISLYGLEEASARFVLDPLKIALYEYENHLIPIDIDPHE